MRVPLAWAVVGLWVARAKDFLSEGFYTAILSGDVAVVQALQKPSDSVERYKLKRLLEELEKKQGRGTELISLYIPPRRAISDVMSMLREEYGTAANIKSKQTRKNVQDALESIMQRLKYFQKAPDTGLVVFCGMIPRGGPGTEKMECYVIIPPEPINLFLYRCDSKFYVEPLKEVIREKEVYGIIVIDREEAAIAVVEGRRVNIVEVLTSGIPGKHDQGGQSQRRFQRIIEQLTHEFYKRVGENANAVFLKYGDALKGVIIAGPGPTKNDFAKGDYLDYRLKKKVVGIVDIGYSGELGVYEALKKAEDLIAESRYAQERKMVQKFLGLLARSPDMVTYGFQEVLDALEKGAVGLVLVSEEVGLVEVKVKCKQCGEESKGIYEEKKIRTEGLQCPKCGGPVEILEERSIVELLAEKAQETGAKVEVISTATPEGEQLKKVFGGVAAILRYKIS